MKSIRTRLAALEEKTPVNDGRLQQVELVAVMDGLSLKHTSKLWKHGDTLSSIILCPPQLDANGKALPPSAVLETLEDRLNARKTF